MASFVKVSFKWTGIYLYFSKSYLYSRRITKGKILKTHFSVLNSFNIPKNQDQFEFLYLYWIPKLYKNPYKQIHIVGVIFTTTTY
jgi:hypothetical protein